MSKKKNLLNFFLMTSPISQHQKFIKIITTPQNSNKLPPTLASNEEYMNQFLKSLQVVTIEPISRNTYKWHPDVQFRKIFKHQYIIEKSSSQASKETDQLLIGIKEFCSQTLDSIIPYQELEQRITIAQPQTIHAVRVKLTYLFKVLLNKRDKLPPSSLELDANLQLSETIIRAFSKNMDYGENGSEWSKLQAMEKLLRARQYKKKGYNEIATNSFQQIFKDEAAEQKTRLEALKILCMEGEEHRDSRILESLMNLTREKGEKEYEQYLKQTIQRIKNGTNNQKVDES